MILIINGASWAPKIIRTITQTHLIVTFYSETRQALHWVWGMEEKYTAMTV